MRIGIIRLGAFGDCVIITPLLRYLKEQGNEVHLMTSERGVEILANNPFIDKLIPYVSNSIAPDKLDEFWSATAKAYEWDKTINLSESIECRLALSPTDPRYNLSKEERKKECDINYYDYTFTHAGYSGVTGKHGELFFEKKADDEMFDYIHGLKNLNGFVVVWGLSGSGRNKTYPWTTYVQAAVLDKYPNAKIITVGDQNCQVLELGYDNDRIIRKSGIWDMGTAMLATKHCDLVVSPDTGLLHAAGCYPTPKIGLLGHTTIENITKTFENDYSIEAKCDCAPCFRLIYNGDVQCPFDSIAHTCLCMSQGLPMERVRDHIFSVIDKVSSGN